MGLIQKAIETYDSNFALVGVYREGHDPIAPIGHILTSANIEITINNRGDFVTARCVDKKEPKILIPVTEESNGRTSSPAAHPLCDQLKYVAPEKEREHKLYLDGLRTWTESEYSHEFLKSILRYVEKKTIITDLNESGLITPKDNQDKSMVCWRVLGIDGEEPACWKNQNLFNSFVDFYLAKISKRQSDLCMVEGEQKAIAIQHPKGIISINGNAKLISANDGTGFTYRGRFENDRQALTMGYESSQKAHNALRWLATEQGVRDFSDNRVFLCWTPSGIRVPKPMRRIQLNTNTAIFQPSDYKKKLAKTLLSISDNAISCGENTVVLAALDAATTGRLAVTYYNEISFQLFLDRMKNWDEKCCWYNGKYGIQAPNLYDIVECAFGVQRGNFLDVDEKIQKQHLQRLLNCKVNGGIFPVDFVKALSQRASSPLMYEEATWRKVMYTACAVLQKYRFDIQQGGDEMGWNLDKKDRSFQYGRLLAVLERAEADYYYRSQETRQTNAIKSMSEYRQRPFLVFERLNRQLHQAYLNRIEPWQAARYEKLTGEIFAILSEFAEIDLNKPLDDVYLMGYELQRNDFFTKKENKFSETEE